MKAASIIISIFFALPAGLIAAWYWYKASVIEVHPVTDAFGGAIATATGPFVMGTMIAMKISSDRNKTAALWTAAAVAMSTIASVAGTVG